VVEPVPYNAAFATGVTVRIAARVSLEDFMATWKYHHQLEPEQLVYAERIAKVKRVGFYHGGGPVYTLEGITGSWLEPRLREP
jgi:hypothetical protein